MVRPWCRTKRGTSPVWARAARSPTAPQGVLPPSGRARRARRQRHGDRPGEPWRGCDARPAGDPAGGRRTYRHRRRQPVARPLDRPYLPRPVAIQGRARSNGRTLCAGPCLHDRRRLHSLRWRGGDGWLDGRAGRGDLRRCLGAAAQNPRRRLALRRQPGQAGARDNRRRKGTVSRRCARRPSRLRLSRLRPAPR